MSTILLSIQPEYVENILAETKKYEFRKRLANSSVKQIYIYCTSPIMKVVGKAHVIAVLRGSPTALWETTKKSAGISREKYRIYFKGCKTAYAYQLGEVNIFDCPKNLEDFGLSFAPQSFVYIDDVDAIQNDGI